MRFQFEGGGKSEAEVLRKELARVKQQNKLLRARLARAEQAGFRDAISPDYRQ